MTKPNHPEIGRALLVSDLKPHTVVWVQKEGVEAVATMWVVAVTAHWVQFRAGAVRTEFMARRYGPDDELLTDATDLPIQTYEYLGEV
jgi:hypothetical protein